MGEPLKALIKKFSSFFVRFSRISRALISLLFLSTVVGVFQNCSKLTSQGEEYIELALQAGSGLSDSNSLTSLQQGQRLYQQHCSRCHGDVATSSKRDRSALMITEALNSVTQMSSVVGLTSEQISLIASALRTETIPVVVDGGRQVFSCDANLVPATPMLKLTRREYRNSLVVLLDEFSSSSSSRLSLDAQLNTLLNAIPSDNLTANRFAAKENNFLLTQQIHDAVFETAFRAGQLVAASTTGLANYPNTNQCLTAATVTQACHQLFVRELASKAFRRPLTVLEGNVLAATLWDNTLTSSQLITLTFASIVQMPDFLYRVYDRGNVSPRGDRVLTLTAHELATKVSYFLTGAPPDATLRNLANSGQILDENVLSQQVDRLLELTSAQELIPRLFKESYGYDRYDSFNYSSAFLNGISTNNLPVAMTQELDDFFNQVVLQQNGSFRDLLTSRYSRISSASLAQIYGLSSAVGETTLPADRPGFLTRAAFLAKKSGNYTSPVKRGLSLLENVLCESIGDPPPNAPTSVSEVQITGQYQTTRQRYTSLSEQPGTTCVQCHSRINSLGYALEGYDSLGRSRTLESIFSSATSAPVTFLPVNTQVQILDLHSSPTLIRNAQELSSDLANNDKALMCFVKHLKEFESRRPASAADGCQNNQALTALHGMSGQQGSIKQAIKSLILSNDFRLWSY